MATKAEIEEKEKAVREKAQTIALAESRVRNLRDTHQHAQGVVREWQTRIAKDGSLNGFDIEAFERDLRASEDAYVQFMVASVQAARLRMDERLEHIDYMATAGRGEQRRG